MDDFNDIMASFGIDVERELHTIRVTDAPVADTPPMPVVTPPQPITQSLSEQDISDILESNGFVDMQEPEEVVEEEGTIDDIDLYIEETENTADESPVPSTELNPVPAPAPTNYAIQPNSPTLLVDTTTSRFSGTEWYNEIQKARIILAGLGGIGSWTALQLARMCPEALYLYDDDVVESANMSGQLYSRSSVSNNKADAMTTIIEDFTSMQNIYAVSERFTTATPAGDIMICGFDNMEARKIFYLKWQEHVRQKPEEERRKCLYLDGRLSIDTLQVFCITGDDTYNMERYCQNYLFSDSEADETVCSLKQTTYLACMIGSLITNLFTNFIANTLNPIIPYDLPFFTEYDAVNMIFKTVK